MRRIESGMATRVRQHEATHGIATWKTRPSVRANNEEQVPWKLPCREEASGRPVAMPVPGGARAVVIAARYVPSADGGKRMVGRAVSVGAGRSEEEPGSECIVGGIADVDWTRGSMSDSLVPWNGRPVCGILDASMLRCFDARCLVLVPTWPPG